MSCSLYWVCYISTSSVDAWNSNSNANYKRLQNDLKLYTYGGISTVFYENLG